MKEIKFVTGKWKKGIKEHRGTKMNLNNFNTAGDHGTLPLELCYGESLTAEEAREIGRNQITSDLIYMLFVLYPKCWGKPLRCY